MTAPSSPDDTQTSAAGSVRSDCPQVDRISELFVERGKLVTQWGILYSAIGPRHAETLKRETQIVDPGATILRLQQEGSR